MINILKKLVDWPDKAEAYTRITVLGILPMMFITTILSAQYKSYFGIPVLFVLIISGVVLMFERSKYEQPNHAEVDSKWN